MEIYEENKRILASGEKLQTGFGTNIRKPDKRDGLRLNANMDENGEQQPHNQQRHKNSQYQVTQGQDKASELPM